MRVKYPKRAAMLVLTKRHPETDTGIIMIKVTRRELHLELASIETPSDVFSFTHKLLNAWVNGCITERQYELFKGDLELHLKTI